MTAAGRSAKATRRPAVRQQPTTLAGMGPVVRKGSGRQSAAKAARRQFARNIFRKCAASKPVADVHRLEAVKILVEECALPNFTPVLPMVFNWDGRPYTLDDHFPLEPFFNRLLPDYMTVKSARQIGKSITQGSRGVFLTTSIPNFTTLYMFPLHEQVSKFSNLVVKKFLDESVLKSYWTGTTTSNNVLLRSFKNQSKMLFSFASLSAARVRGNSANYLCIDEADDMDPSHIPVIREVLSASRVFDTRENRFRYASFSVNTGTPKTYDGYLQSSWTDSSQAEWAIPCRCGYTNYPTLGLDLDRMIGPYHDDIGEVHRGGRPATICAKCGQWVNPRDGFWHHRFEERISTHPGYHIPQIILPMHYAEPKKWADLLAKRSSYPAYRFYNEVMGEAYDTGAKLVTETDLRKAACLPWRNSVVPEAAALRSVNRYVLRFLGVDWGGGGDEMVSFTTAAVLGMLPDGKLDVIYGRRLFMPNDAIPEAAELMKIFNMFRCHAMCHDYNGAGAQHEQIMIQMGLPINKVVPLVYNRSGTKDIMVFHGHTEEHHRKYYLLDKPRSLGLTCEMIKLGQIRFFQDDYKHKDDKGLIRDFLSLYKHKMQTERAGEVYMVHSKLMSSDDFAHSVNFAACGMWYRQQQWPNIPKIAGLQLTLQQHDVFNPIDPWADQLELGM